MSDIHYHRMFDPDPIECAMCPNLGQWIFAVPYYCGVVREGCSEGGYKSVCKPCHDRWAAWNDSLAFYGS